MLGLMPHQMPHPGSWARQSRSAWPAARPCPPRAYGSLTPLPPVVRCTSQTSDVAELGIVRAVTTPTIWLCPDIADGGPIVIGGARPGAPAESHHRVAWPRRPAPAPWEGPLVSESSELLSDASSTPTEAEGAPVTTRRRRTGTGLSAMVLPELQALASRLGISGTGRMRKSQLIAAIQEKQGQHPDSGRPGAAKSVDVVGAPAERATEVAGTSQMNQANDFSESSGPTTNATEVSAGQAPVTERPRRGGAAPADRGGESAEQTSTSEDGSRFVKSEQQTIAEEAESESGRDVSRDGSAGRDGASARDGGGRDGGGREGGGGRDGGSGRDGGGRDGGRQRQRNGRDPTDNR